MSNTLPPGRSALYDAFVDLAKAHDEKVAAERAAARRQELLRLECLECEDPGCPGNCGTDEGMHQHYNGGW